jgi:pre-mRNA-processing factor 6
MAIHSHSLSKVIERVIRSLQKEGLEIDREAWTKEAEAAERTGSVLSCQAIINNTIRIGMEEEYRRHMWFADAEECEKHGSIEIAQAICALALSVFLTKTKIWLKATNLEKKNMG